MEYREFANALVELFSGYAKSYPKSEWVKTVLCHYTAALENCDGMAICNDAAKAIIESNERFSFVLRDNPELTTEKLVSGDYKIPAEWR